MFLLDTNIISALAPHNVERYPGLAEWIRRNNEVLFLSVVTASEVEAGIAKALRRGAHVKARRLRVWWDAIVRLYDRRLVDVDLDIAAEAGRLLDSSRAFDPGYEDIVIAATAKVHGLTVATDNERHFRPLRVPVANPLRELPQT